VIEFWEEAWDLIRRHPIAFVVSLTLHSIGVGIGRGLYAGLFG
jgi:hypothetical protein